MNGPRVERGAVAWAFVATACEASTRVWRAKDERVETITAAALARERCDGHHTLLTDAMLRPVVMLHDRPGALLGDVLVLPTVGLTKLTDAEREHVRDQREPSLFHLPVRPGKYGLHHEVAIDLNGLSRLGTTRMLPRAVGHLDANEMRVLGERLAAHLDLDLAPVVARKVEERLARLAEPGML